MRRPTSSYPGRRLVEEVEQIIMQRHDLLHELHILHQAGTMIVGKELDRGHGSHSTRIQSGRMYVTAFHQAEHLASHTAHLQGFAVESAGEGIQSPS